jgi:hypothetical protein
MEHDAISIRVLSGRLIGGVMREHIGANDEQIVAIPALQVLIDRAVAVGL